MFYSFLLKDNPYFKKNSGFDRGSFSSFVSMCQNSNAQVLEKLINNSFLILISLITLKFLSKQLSSTNVLQRSYPFSFCPIPFLFSLWNKLRLFSLLTLEQVILLQNKNYSFFLIQNILILYSFFLPKAHLMVLVYLHIKLFPLSFLVTLATCINQNS